MKKRFALKQHQELGFAVKLTRDFILALTVDLRNAYPMSHRAVKSASRALKALDTLKSELDELVCSENPRASNEEVLGAYYGARPWRGRREVFELFESLRQRLIEGDKEETPLPSKS